MKSHRSITTILFTDIVGSTERAAELGDRGWRDLLAQHHELVRQALHRYHGHEIATAGDGFLAVFDAAEWAILCGDAIRNGLRDLGLEVRCGAHMGEVEQTAEGDIGGIAVHVGSRVAAEAAPGEILVTGGVRDAELGSGFGFDDRGRYELKGVPGEWRLWAVADIPEGADAEVPEPEASRLEPSPAVWTRVKQSRIVQVAAIYLLVSWIVLQTTDLFVRSVGLPEWALPAAVVLLLIGLVVILATAWVQSRPETKARAKAGELPRAGAVDVAGLRAAIAQGKLPHLTWGRSILAGVVAFALVFGLAGLYVVVQDRGASFAPDEALADAAPGIAVLPFTVQGAGLDVWREGAVDLIGSNLDGVAGLRAIDSRTLLARWREGVKEGEEPDLATSLEVARRTGARFALVGSAVALGRDLRLTADIYEVSDGRSLGQAQVQGSPDSVYLLVDKLSIEVLKAILGGEVEDLPRIRLARVTTASLPALKAYLEGEALYRKADWEGALAAYREAVEADSTFALAWQRVAESIGWLPGENWPEQTRPSPSQQAARWSGRLPERESVFVLAYRAFTAGSMTMLERLESTSRRYPDDPELVYQLGEFYVHYGDQLLVDPAKTERVLDHAIELDPSFAPYYLHAIEYAFYRADSARALDLLATFEGLVGDTPDSRLHRLHATLAWGSPSERSTALAAIDTLPTGDLPQCQLFAAPRFADLQQACARAILENAIEDRRVLGPRAYYLLFASLGTGNIETFHEDLRAARGFPALGLRDDFEVAALYYLRQRDLPVDGDRLREAAASYDRYPSPFFAAVLAAEDGRTDGVRAFQEIAGAFRDSLVARGDSLTAGRIEGMLRMIEGYVALQRGERERALALLVEGQKRGTDFEWTATGSANRAARWTIGDLLVDLGRPEEAIPYYRSFRFDPFAAVELGKIYEGLGRVDQAKEQYEIALAHWREADPVLAPRVAEVRERLAGLGFQPRS